MDDGRGRFAEISNEVAEQVRSASGGRDKVPIFEVDETIPFEVVRSRFAVSMPLPAL